MDISKEYIEMCKKAQEIQSLRAGTNGSCVLELGDMFYRLGFNYWFDGKANQPRIDKTVWLPRQDQLQEMVLEEYKDSISLNIEFGMQLYNTQYTSNHEKYHFFNDFRSSEQLWLAFVMYNKHAKQWNSETKEWGRL